MIVGDKFTLKLGHYSCDNCRFDVFGYSGERIALMIVGEMEDVPGEFEPVAMVTVNLPDEPCGEGEAYIKNYSENEGMVLALHELGVIEAKPVGFANSGFVMIERYKLTTDFLGKLVLAGLDRFR